MATESNGYDASFVPDLPQFRLCNYCGTTDIKLFNSGEFTRCRNCLGAKEEHIYALSVTIEDLHNGTVRLTSSKIGRTYSATYQKYQVDRALERLRTVDNLSQYILDTLSSGIRQPRILITITKATEIIIAPIIKGDHFNDKYNQSYR
jgi:hypothetical protein